MTRKRYRKPASPEEVARQVAERRENDANIARLGAMPDAVYKIGPTGKITSAKRLDVFDMLYDHGRGKMSKGGYFAARRMEEDIAARLKQDTDRSVAARMMAHSATPITDRSFDAGKRVDAALWALGLTAGGMMQEMISTPQGAILSRWHPIAEKWTKETNPHAQRAAVRAACERLAEWYRDADNERPKKRGDM